MTTVAVLGSSGMLGSMVTAVLAAQEEIDVIATRRGPERNGDGSMEWRSLDVTTSGVDEIETSIRGADWVINAIGVIKQRIDETVPADVRSAILVNSLFPHALAEAAERTGARVIQIATDCVFSGARGNYVESDHHDPLDVYGKTKSLGEVGSELVRHLRCSIVGPEKSDSVSLLGWLLKQRRGASISGFANHRWNGLTTLHFAKLCVGLIVDGGDLPSPLHLVPQNQVTKAELLNLFAEAFDRTDIQIDVVDATQPIDRTLATEFSSVNTHLWRTAGYAGPASVETMISELAEFCGRA